MRQKKEQPFTWYKEFGEVSFRYHQDTRDWWWKASLKVLHFPSLLCLIGAMFGVRTDSISCCGPAPAGRQFPSLSIFRELCQSKGGEGEGGTLDVWDSRAGRKPVWRPEQGENRDGNVMRRLCVSKHPSKHFTWINVFCIWSLIER